MKKSTVRDFLAGIATCLVVVWIVGGLAMLTNPKPTTSPVYSITSNGITYWPTGPLRRTEFGVEFNTVDNCVVEVGGTWVVYKVRENK